MWLRPPLRCLPTFQNLISISRIGNQCGCLAEGRSENGGSATGKYPGAPRNPLGVFLVASKMGLRLEVKAAHERFSDGDHKRDPSHVSARSGKEDKVREVCGLGGGPTLTHLLQQGGEKETHERKLTCRILRFTDTLYVMRRNYEQVDYSRIAGSLEIASLGAEKRRGTGRECFSCCRGRSSEEIGHVL